MFLKRTTILPVFVLCFTFAMMNVGYGQRQKKNMQTVNNHLIKSTVTTQEVENFVKKAFLAISKLNFANYKKQMKENKKYFTNESWINWKNGIEESRNLERLKHSYMIKQGEIDGPIILWKKVKTQNKVWMAVMPVQINWTSATTLQYIQRLKVRMIMQEIKKHNHNSFTITNYTEEKKKPSSHSPT